MIIDSSALVAVLRDEPECVAFLEAMDRAVWRASPPPSLLETSMVLAGKYGPDSLAELDAFVAVAEIETLAFTAEHAAVAGEAFLRFGKGRHPAGLNFGDCIAYAAARVEAMPLLFKGGDFARTDVERAV